MSESRGITLIVLIITIVVLLILAGVTVAHITGGEGIIEQASDSKFKTEILNLEKRIGIILIDRDDEYSGSINELLGEDNEFNEILRVEEGKIVYVLDAVSAQEKQNLEELGIHKQSDFYTVSFDLGENQDIITRVVKSGTKVEVPKVNNTYFKGWYYLQESGSADNPTYTEMTFDANTAISNNYSLYAKYYNEAIIRARNTSISFWKSEYRPYITSIVFTAKSSKVPTSYIEVSNISENSDSAPIMAYIIDKTVGENVAYEVVVYSPNVIYCSRNAQQFFYSFSNLETIDFENFNTSNVVTMQWMFRYCYKLKNISFSENFKTANVTNMGVLFSNCTSLTELDLSSFDTSNVVNMNIMFSSCYNLKTVYVSDKFSTENVKESTNMFYNCGELTGSSGTKFKNAHRDAEYARIDNPPDSPGYFTLKEN